MLRLKNTPVYGGGGDNETGEDTQWEGVLASGGKKERWKH